MERVFNKIEANVPVVYEVTDVQLGQAGSEAVEESPSAFLDCIGEDAVLRMAAVMYKADPIGFQGLLISIVSNPTTVSPNLDESLDLNTI